MIERETEIPSNIVFGVRPLEEALNSKASFIKIYVQKGIGEGLKHIKNLLNKHKENFTEVPKEKLDSLSKFQNHQGVVAKISPIVYHNAENLCQTLFTEDKEPFFIILDRITDVRNFGAIARTALSAGCHAIIIPEKGSAGVNQDAIKTSAGALLHLPVCKSSNLFQTVKHLKDDGIQIICLTEKANKDLYFEKLSKPCAIVVGNEEDGIHPSILKLADKMVKIPMGSQFDSLNVSVASGIALYEVIRQSL